MTNSSFVPVCEPCLLGNEAQYVAEAVASGWLSGAGPFINRFEEGFSAYCGVKHGVSCSNGTTALHLALRSLGIEEGDEVIIPDFTMIAVLYSVLYCGATPVFVDAETDTWNINPELLKEKITSRTKAIIAVHTYGHPVDFDPLLKIAREYGIPVVEDAAEVHGAEYHGRKCGSLGDISCFSFFGNKIITTGEGGMVLTNDAALADKCRYYRNLCFPMKGPRDYVHDDLGYNYRLTNIQAALGVAQLENIEEFVSRRRRNAEFYLSALREVPGIQLPVQKSYARNVYWMFGIVVNRDKFGMTRDELMDALKKENIDSRYFFKPMHNQKVLDKFGLNAKGTYPVSKALSENGFYLPSGSGLTDAERERVCKAIKKQAK